VYVQTSQPTKKYVFVYTLTPCVLHKYRCVFDGHIYMYWS